MGLIDDLREKYLQKKIDEYTEDNNSNSWDSAKKDDGLEEPEENTSQNNKAMNKYLKIGLIVAGVAAVGFLGWKFLKPKKDK